MGRRLGLVLPLALAVASSAALAYSRDGDNDGEGTEIETRLERINQQLMDLQNQEFDLSMGIVEARQKAKELLKEPAKATQHLAQGKLSRDLLRYKAVLLASAKQTQQYDRRFLPLLRQIEALQKRGDKASKQVQARIDQTADRIQAKHRSNLEKIARFYEQAAEWPQALRVFLQVYSMMPEKERTENQALIKTIGTLYNKIKDFKGALAFYRSLFEAKGPKERYQDKKLAQKVADLYAKTGDTREALLIYRRLLTLIPKAEKHQGERERLLKKIRQLGGR